MGSVDGDSPEEKQRTLIGHLLSYGHFGPFKHPQATFAIEGMSRSCMAQITRHRHVSFDVQSMRYVDLVGVDPEEVRAGEMVVVPPSAMDPDGWVVTSGRTRSTRRRSRSAKGCSASRSPAPSRTISGCSIWE